MRSTRIMMCSSTTRVFWCSSYKSLLLTFVAALVLSTSDALNVTGTIAAPTTWTSIDSPVYVEGLLEITDSLTVEAGVSVTFTASTSGLRVRDGGTLRVLGSVTERVIMEPLHQDDVWVGIEFAQGATPATFTQDDDISFAGGSILQYTDIKFVDPTSSQVGALECSQGAGTCSCICIDRYAAMQSPFPFYHCFSHLELMYRSVLPSCSAVLVRRHLY
jgi:hypothetical protein